MKPVILFGNGQVAAVSYYNLTHDSDCRVAAFTVDSAYLTEPAYYGLPVVAFEEVERRFPPDAFDMLLSISFRGVNRLRAEKYAAAKAKGYRLIRYVSSRAHVPAGVELGDNVVIGANCSIGPYVRIGSNVTIASGSVVGHHTVIADHCFLAGGCTVAGSVHIGSHAFLGTGAIVRDRIRIAPGTVVGAGVVILEDTVERGVYAAAPPERLPITSDQLRLE